MHGTRTRRAMLTTSCAALTLVALTACGSSGSGGSTSAGGSSASGGLPSTIPVTLLADKTGPQAFYGAQLEAGVQTALKAVESSGLLGKSKIVLTVKDTTSVQAQAITVMSSIVQSKPVAILGPSLSPEALATAPTAQSAKIPYLLDTSPKGLLDVGDYIYSMTTRHASQIPTLAKHLATTVKQASIIYSNDNPTIVDADKAAQSAFPAAGVKITDNIGTPLQSTDFSAVASKAIAGKPDAIGVFGGGPMMSGVTKALRAAGYTGPLFGNMGADGTVGKAGDAANGFTYMAEWAPGAPGKMSTDFASQFSAAYPDLTPYYPAVDGYNEVMFLAQALKAAGSTDSAALLKAMQGIAAKGFTTVGGESTFTDTGNRQLVDPSIVAQFNGGKITAVTS
jgi:branched-chain amino acid transport system substrate-binding protein